MKAVVWFNLPDGHALCARVDAEYDIIGKHYLLENVNMYWALDKSKNWNLV